MNVALRATDRTLRACAAFGVTGLRADEHDPREDALALSARITPGVRVLVRGASGSGKSRLARALASVLALRGERVVCADPTRGPARACAGSVLDAIPGPVARAWSLLSRAGLADATLLARRACELSEGEGFRLLLARALACAPGVLVVDEFCGALDARAARGVCLALSARGAPCALVVVTAREDVARWFRADVVVTCDRGRAEVTEGVS